MPNVLLVVQGGPGTYATVQKSIESGVRVILVKESRGAAQVIAEYIEPLLPDAEHLVTLNKDDLLARLKQRDDEFAATFARLNRKMRPEQQKKLWDDLHYIAGRLDLLTIFSKFTEKTFDVVVLQAIVDSFKESNKKESKVRDKRRKAKVLDSLTGSEKLHGLRGARIRCTRLVATCPTTNADGRRSSKSTIQFSTRRATFSRTIEIR